MSSRVDNTLKNADQKVDGALDSAFQGAEKANSKAQKFFNSPEERKEVWGEAKKNPLAYSFILVQLLVSFVPVATAATFSAGVATFGIAGAVVGTIIALSIALSILVPVLFVTVPFAAFIWASIAGTLAAADWLYNRFYVETGMKTKVAELTDELADEAHEIEENAIREYEQYSRKAIESGREVRDQGKEYYDEASRKTQDAYGSAKQKAIEAGDDVSNRLDNNINAAKQKAGDVQQQGKEVKDETKRTAKNTAQGAQDGFRS